MRSVGSTPAATKTLKLSALSKSIQAQEGQRNVHYKKPMDIQTSTDGNIWTPALPVIERLSTDGTLQNSQCNTSGLVDCVFYIVSKSSLNPHTWSKNSQTARWTW